MRRLLIAPLSVLALVLSVLAVSVAGALSAGALVGVEMVALSDDGTTLVRFDSAFPGTIVASTPVAGLAAAETLIGIDVRPATAQLVGVTSAGRVLVLDPDSGAVVRSVSLAADVTDASSPFTALAGTRFGVDFNPVPDRLRVVSDTGQNLRINADTGATTTDGNLNPATPDVVGAAYTNSTANPAPTSTQLYDIDAAGDRLLLQNPPNDGTLVVVGSLGVDTDERVGFDIAPNGVAYASLTVAGVSRLYTVDLTTGATTPVGTIGNGTAVRGLAVLPASPPPTVALLSADGTTLSFLDPRNPTTALASVPVTGVGVEETLVGIDMRPATGALYAVSVDGSGVGRLYTISTTTGATMFAATLAPDPADLTNPYTALTGSAFGVDFNPVPDRLRVISDSDQNLRINVSNGLVTTDGPIAYAATDANAAVDAVVPAAAYTNSVAGAASTTLVDVETTLDVLAVQDPPNSGTLLTGGALGALSANVSFDISPDNRWAVITNGVRLDAVELGTPIGAATAPAGRRALFGAIADSIGIAFLSPSTPLPPAATAATTAPRTVVGLRDDGTTLVTFNAASPGTITGTRSITGLGAGEVVVGIDHRPATTELYAVTSAGRVLVIDAATGGIVRSVTLVADGADMSDPYTGLSGTSFGVDFNPVPDRLRVVSDTGQNLRINVDTGATTTDGTLKPGTPDLAGAAYTNSTANPAPTSTQLYDVDAGGDQLLLQTPPNDGTLVLVGPLGVDTDDRIGFDIDGPSNRALASLTVGGVSRLYGIDLLDGSADFVGTIGNGAPLRGMSVVFVEPQPSTPPGSGPVEPQPEPEPGDEACPPGTAPARPFTDVDPGSVHAPGIACAAARGITKGKTMTTYDPAGTVTRGQVASFLNRFLASAGVTLPDGPDAFGDDDGSVHEDAIDALAAAGIIKGKGPGLYAPAAAVTRGQLASLLRGAYEEVTAEALAAGPDAFGDDDGSVHEDAIDALAAAEILLGRPDGKFGINDSTRRDQLATVLTRALDGLVADGFAESL